MSNPRAKYYEPNPELQNKFQVELAFRGEDGSDGVFMEVFPEDIDWDGLKVGIAKTHTGDQTFGQHLYYSKLSPDIKVKMKFVSGEHTRWIQDHARECALSHTHHGRWMLRVMTFGEDMQVPERIFEFDYGVCPDVFQGFSLSATKEDLATETYEIEFETIYFKSLATHEPFKGSHSPPTRQHTYTGTGVQPGSAWGGGVK